MEESSSPCREVDKAEPEPKVELYLSEALAGEALGKEEEEGDGCPLERGLVDIVRLSLIPICRGFLLFELDAEGSTAGEVGVDARAASREAPALTTHKDDEGHQALVVGAKFSTGLTCYDRRLTVNALYGLFPSNP